MSFARKASKALVLPFGITTRRRDGDVVILAYHRVGAGDREVDLPRDLFARQLDALQARSSIISLEAALSGRASGVVLTFDDGTPDFHEHVLPEIVARGVPAHLYLATSFMYGEGGAGDGASLTWDALRESLATGLVTVGSHTHSHRNLARAGRDEAFAEVQRSKDLIEDRLGTACRHFAYPWGVASAEAHDVVVSHFDSVALEAWVTNRRGTIDAAHLGRTPVLRSDGVLFFGAKAAGLLDREAWVYRALRRGPWGQA